MKINDLIMIWQSASSYLWDTLFSSRYVWVLGCARAWCWVLIPTCKTQGMTTCLAQPQRDGMFWTSSGTHHKVNLWEDGKNMSQHIKNKMFSHSAEEKLITLIWLLIPLILSPASPPPPHQHTNI